MFCFWVRVHACPSMHAHAWGGERASARGALAQVRDHNATRGKHGRFLLGHKAIDGARGGLFVLDVSAAMVGYPSFEPGTGGQARGQQRAMLLGAC